MVDFIAKKKYRLTRSSLDKIGISMDQYHGKRYVLIHYFNNESIFNIRFDAATNIEHLNDIKSKLINHKFKIDWDQFNKAMRHLS